MARLKSTLRVFSILFVLAAAAVSTAQADVLDEVLERGKLRVGVAEFVPWTMRTKSGELVGFEVDIARKIADDMGVDIELVLYDWDRIIDGLHRGEIDMIAGGMAITPARALQVNFTRPVATSGVGIAANTEMTSDIETLADLNKSDVKLSTVVDTLAAGVAQKLFPDADLTIHASPGPAEADVLEGRAHAYLASLAEAQFLALKNPDVVDMPVSKPLLASAEALAVNKGEQELLNFLNAWVTARQADEWLPTTHDYWFASLDWTERVTGE